MGFTVTLTYMHFLHLDHVPLSSALSCISFSSHPAPHPQQLLFLTEKKRENELIFEGILQMYWGGNGFLKNK